jgi:hypothetical protein
VTGGFKADGFHDSDLPIAVRYADAATHNFVGPDWRVDNFVVRPDGTIGEAKTAKGYKVDQEIDLDDDGKPETRTVFAYELKLVNRVTTASIWVEGVMLPMHQKDRSLRSFLDDLVETISGTGVYQINGANPKRVGTTKSYGARVIDAKDSKVGGFDALDATLEVVNLDQLKVDPNAKSSVGRVVFVRTDYDHQIRSAGHDYADTRVMVVVGCDSNPRDFDATNADFTRFLQSMELGEAADGGVMRAATPIPQMSAPDAGASVGDATPSGG